MMIEQNTNYAYKLKYTGNPTFDKVRDLSTKFYRELPQALQDELHEALNRGIDILDSEPQMTAYLFAFGKMHQAKLEYAFGKLPEEFLEQPEINIIDYGCGQALGTMCYADYLRENGYSQKVKTITLIEPSEICLKRAALHASMFFPDAEIKTVNKKFDDLTQNDIVCSEETRTLHILSNVLDMLNFDLDRFSALIKDSLNGYNQFVCVGPYFNYSEIDNRMTEFCSLLNGDGYYIQSFDKYEFNEDKSWTAQILCFSVSEKVEVNSLSTEVTKAVIDNGIEDEFGVIYSKNGKRLLKCNNSKLESYSIKYGTKEICYQAFESCSLLSQISIPDSVEKIDGQAFLACESLQQVVIPTSITSIGWEAFSLCNSLQQIDIPNSVTSLGAAAFFRCTSLLRIVIPDSITRIDYQTFSECDSLQQIIISNSVKIIGDWAFSECESLKQISIPNSVTYIGEGAFSKCESLQQVTFPDSLCCIGAFAFEECKSLQRITIPDSVNHIMSGAFSRCTSLQQITIPNSVTVIGDEIFFESAFKDCRALQQIIIPKGSTERFKKMIDKELWEKFVEISAESTSRICQLNELDHLTTNVTEEDLGEAIEDEYGCAYSKDGKRLLRMLRLKNSNHEKYSIKQGTKVICSNAFHSCSLLRQVIIPDSVISVGDCAFAFCHSLHSINLPNSVINIGDCAFVGCQSLQEITIPHAVTSIRFRAFWGCESLQRIIIPNSITSIGDEAFCRCRSLRQIIIPKSVTSIGHAVFTESVNLEVICDSKQFVYVNNMLIDKQKGVLISYNGNESDIVIPSFVTNIGDKAFDKCKSLQQITIPNSVTSIGFGAFSECSSLQQINIPNTVTNIGNWAFYECNSLLQIIIPNSVTNIGDAAFSDCKSLKQFIIPDSITRIGNQTFERCRSMRQIFIPDSITSIGDWAFDECESLQQIIIPQGSYKKIKKMVKKELWNRLIEK